VAYTSRSQPVLAGRSIGNGQLAVGSTPDTADTATGADEKRGRGEAHKSQKQCVLDKILALLVLDELVACQQPFRPALRLRQCSFHPPVDGARRIPKQALNYFRLRRLLEARIHPAC
jgi:hypothetical protein